MSNVPEAFMKAAREALRCIDGELLPMTCLAANNQVARALMAADEAATKRAVRAVDAQISEYQTEQKSRRANREITEAFAAGEAIIALTSVKATILKGDA